MLKGNASDAGDPTGENLDITRQAFHGTRTEERAAVSASY